MTNNNTSTIADTSGLISLISESDSNWEKAQKIKNLLKKHSRPMIIPAEIYAETMNVLGRKGGHEFAVTSMDNLLISSLILVVESNNEIRFNAVTLFEKSPASVSYTDCLVMAFADHFETKIIFGFDGAFAKNDYKLPA